MAEPQKTVLITGGNSGIGKHTAIGLARSGWKVVITSRNLTRGKEAVAEIREASGCASVEMMELDLASFASIRTFADAFLRTHPRLHVLLNNAGLILSERRTTQEGFEATFGVNHLGHFLLTQLLLPVLEASAPSRIVNLSSGAHRGARNGLDFDDLQLERRYSAFDAYSKSKLANIHFTRELANRLEGTGVTAYAVHPGGVNTGFAADGDVRGFFAFVMRLARPFLLTAEQGAATSIYVATAPVDDLCNGGYYAKSSLTSTTDQALDDAAARRLWEVSELLVETSTTTSGRASSSGD